MITITKAREVRFWIRFFISFSMHLVMEHKFCFVDLIARSIRTWERNQITPTYNQVSTSVTPLSVIISYVLKEILLLYKNTIGKTTECYVLSVITCSTPFFVNCTSISVNFEKIKVIIYESIHFKHVITFIPYSLRTSQIFSIV